MALKASTEPSEGILGHPEHDPPGQRTGREVSVFKRVMESLDVEVITHMPASCDGRRTTARAKGKVERPFRTVKDAHETLYHFHEPEIEAEPNRWLARYVATYKRSDHKSEPHSRIDDWLAHLPAEGVRQMCAWERFCVFACEPKRRLVGIDCRLTVAGVTYEVDAELAGETASERTGAELQCRCNRKSRPLRPEKRGRAGRPSQTSPGTPCRKHRQDFTKFGASRLIG
jgi:hypothetical protein